MPAGRYVRPPITEAVIEVRFGSAISSAMLARFLRAVAKEYPLTEQTYDISVQLLVVEGANKPEVRPDQQFSGYKMTGRDEADLLLIGHDKIATVRVSPYCGWELFLDRARLNYDILKKISGRRRLTRLATRYINRLDIPSLGEPRIQTEDYLLVEPRVPQIIPNVSFFSTRFVGVVPEVEGQVIVNASTIPSPLIDHASLLLDIDLFREQALPQKDEDIWELFGLLRRQKNVLFESFITDRARELFDRA